MQKLVSLQIHHGALANSNRVRGAQEVPLKQSTEAILYMTSVG